jgi:hypothetical protein
LYAVCVAYPLVLGRRALSRSASRRRGQRRFFFAARAAAMQGGLGPFVGAVPLLEGAVMTVRCGSSSRWRPVRPVTSGGFVAGTALAFATV